MNEVLLKQFHDVTSSMYDRCYANAPNFGVSRERFQSSLEKTVEKALASSSASELTAEELTEILGQIQAEDLFLAIACADGNERAWWDFDQGQRSYMQRVARHLAKTEMDADEVVDWVYGELYGTRIVDGERVSKFAGYGGRGSLRGWLRTVIWHAIVDMHRASHDEVSLDEMTENIGEGAAHATFAVPAKGGEESMVSEIALNRYRAPTASAIAKAFAGLDPHERLLLSYYHVDGLKLREIARLAERESSPLRGWFQRRSPARDTDSGSRVHESTVMRWLEKCYAKVSASFRNELGEARGFKPEEIEICLGLAANDVTGGSLFRGLVVS
jgi:RNA polymerase sigma-70 factor